MNDKKWIFDREFYEKIEKLEPTSPDADWDFEFITGDHKWVNKCFGPSMEDATEKARRFAEKYNIKKWRYIGAFTGGC